MRFISSTSHALWSAALAASVALSCLSLFGNKRAYADDAPSKVSIPISAVSRLGYSTTAFDTTAQKLPASFQGNDSFAVYVNTPAFLPTIKEKFETTQQFNDRVAASKKSFIIGSSTLDSVYAFQADPSVVTTSYDANKGQMSVNLKFSEADRGFDSGDFDVIRLTGPYETDKRSYAATNGLGAGSQVAKVPGDTVNLFTTNRKDFHLKWDRHTPFFSYRFVFPMAVDAAKTAKPKIAVLAVCHLVQFKGSYVADYHHQTTPTAASPIALNVYDDYIAVKLDQIWIYNSDTGDVYQQIMPQSKK